MILSWSCLLCPQNFLAAAFVFFFVPEMSGLSLEEINLLFQSNISYVTSQPALLQPRPED